MLLGTKKIKILILSISLLLSCSFNSCHARSGFGGGFAAGAFTGIGASMLFSAINANQQPNVVVVQQPTPAQSPSYAYAAPPPPVQSNSRYQARDANSANAYLDERERRLEERERQLEMRQRRRARSRPEN